MIICDGDDERIRAMEIAVWFVGPGTGFGINGGRSVGRCIARFNGEVGAIS